MDVYDIVQFGSGGIDRGEVVWIYVGAWFQRGHGVYVLSRSVLSLLTNGARVVGKEAMNTGINIFSDVASKNTLIGESFQSRVKESGESLKRKVEEKLKN